jgi:hypothetical protein
MYGSLVWFGPVCSGKCYQFATKILPSKYAAYMRVYGLGWYVGPLGMRCRAIDGHRAALDCGLALPKAPMETAMLASRYET